jgi:hypothetical protein
MDGEQYKINKKKDEKNTLFFFILISVILVMIVIFYNLIFVKPYETQNSYIKDIDKMEKPVSTIRI